MAEKQVSKNKDLTQNKIEVSRIGKPFVVGSKVSFSFHSQRFEGVVEKQLKNSAILAFVGDAVKSNLAQDLKQ